MTTHAQGTTPSSPSWRNRIVELRYCAPHELDDHPQQWRVHGDLQRRALESLLREIGIAGAGLAYMSSRTGRLTSIDGHLRKSLTDVPFPTLILDVDDAEAALLLASYDPLAVLATTNQNALAQLLADVQSSEPALQQMLSQLAQDAGITPPDFPPVGLDEQGRLDALAAKAKLTCPACGEEFTP